MKVFYAIFFYQTIYLLFIFLNQPFLTDKNEDGIYDALRLLPVCKGRM